MILFFDGKRFVETRYDRESEFEAEVVRSHKTFFGPKAIYVNAKQKIDTKALGGSIPDGFLFNLADVDEVPERLFNEVLWKAIKGPDAKMPAPRYCFGRR